jgi:hypothetical protein
MKLKLHTLNTGVNEINNDLISHAKWMKKFREKIEDRKEGPMLKRLREKLK